MIRRLLTFLLAALITFHACISSAADSPAVQDDITINSDRMEHDNKSDTITAIGHVTIKNQGMVLSSDKAVLLRSKRFITASGNVIIEREGSTTYGETATMDIDSGRVEIDQGATSMKGSETTFISKKFTRESETKYVFTENEFTACDVSNPSWKFSSSSMKVNPNGYAVGRNVIFYVKDVPVFYLPWVAFPVGKEKRSGILPPQYGYSKSKGYQLDIPFYWNIAPNQDLTFDVDILTSRGVGLAATYRYLRKRGSSGSIGGYIIHDTKRSMWRGQFFQDHYEELSDTMNLRSAININSDRNFLTDYALKIGEYNRQSSESSINFLKTWRHYALTASARYTQDYYSGSNTGTLQYLPEIGLAAVRQRILSTPLYFDFDATASNFYREKGLKGQRIVAFPRLTLVTGLPGYLHFSAYGGAYLRGYNSTDSTAGSMVKASDGNIIPDMGARLNSSLSRIYTTGFDRLVKLRHEIVPEVSYHHTDQRDQSSLPYYDYSDRLVHQDIIYYGFTSHLGGKYKTGDSHEYLDLSRVRLYQGYSINGSRRDVLAMSDRNKPFTDVILESETRIAQYAKLLFDARYDIYARQLSSVAPGLAFKNNQGDMATFSYRMAKNSTQPSESVEYAEMQLATKYFDPFTLKYNGRYSLDKPGFLASVYTMEYRHQCWSVTASFYDRPGNPGFAINFNLQGMSS
ncbi:MAG TPA: LPS assembly protein LptD, partial [Deltaproteobacteria bacterium]|nr:LPS assembly protein LptD [Deltaproteobacteria bacterium]